MKSCVVHCSLYVLSLECPSWTYGAGCSKECACVLEKSSGCRANNGSCVCKPGYQGTACQSGTRQRSWQHWRHGQSWAWRRVVIMSMSAALIQSVTLAFMEMAAQSSVTVLLVLGVTTRVASVSRIVQQDFMGRCVNWVSRPSKSTNTLRTETKCYRHVLHVMCFRHPCNQGCACSSCTCSFCTASGFCSQKGWIYFIRFN